MIYDSSSLNSITGQIIGLAIKVHRLMGPGLLESVYLTCLCYELKKAGLIVEREKMVPLFYEGIRLDQSYRLDLLVQEKVIVEIKAVESITAVHRAQLLSYLKLTGCPIGLLINFNVELLKVRCLSNGQQLFRNLRAYRIFSLEIKVLSVFTQRSLRLCG
jgi:GxxExxY protein